MSELTTKKVLTDRRTFLQWSIFGLLFSFFAATVNIIFRYLMPPPPAIKTEELSIPVSQIPPGGSLIVKYKGEPVILIHLEEGVSAFSPVCTHLGCIVKWVRDKEVFSCPCHVGIFDKTGKVLAGPPPEPLHPVNIKVREDTIVFV